LLTSCGVSTTNLQAIDITVVTAVTTAQTWISALSSLEVNISGSAHLYVSILRHVFQKSLSSRRLKLLPIYVCSSVTIAIQKDHALLVSATAQSSDLFPPPLKYPVFVDELVPEKELSIRLECSETILQTDP